jgi:hypothetical protein
MKKKKYVKPKMKVLVKGFDTKNTNVVYGSCACWQMGPAASCPCNIQGSSFLP